MAILPSQILCINYSYSHAHTHTHTRTQTHTNTHTHTLQGKLDFLSYPSRLMIVDLVPNIINAVMLLQVSPRSSSDISTGRLERVSIDVNDQTG